MHLKVLRESLNYNTSLPYLTEWIISYEMAKKP